MLPIVCEKFCLKQNFTFYEFPFSNKTTLLESLCCQTSTMASKLAFCLLLATLSFANAENFSFSSLFKHKSVLNGHFGHYLQNFSRYPVDNPLGAKVIGAYVYRFLFKKGDPTIRFMAVNCPPHLFTKRNKKGFTVWGPLYSVLLEAARFINYR